VSQRCDRPGVWKAALYLSACSGSNPDGSSRDLLAPLIEAMGTKAPVPHRPHSLAAAQRSGDRHADFAIQHRQFVRRAAMVAVIRRCDVLAVHVGQPATWRQVLEMLDARMSGGRRGGDEDPVDGLAGGPGPCIAAWAAAYALSAGADGMARTTLVAIWRRG